MGGLRLTRKQAVVCGLVAVVGTVVVWVGLGLFLLGTCVLEERNPAWPWSPKIEYCDGESRATTIAAYAALAAPAVLAALGAVLWAAAGSRWAIAAFLLVPVPAILVGQYVASLPYHYIETTPVLHNPYLRTATDARPARACYAYGIIRGRRKTVVTPDTERVCVDLEQTPEARALTPEYDQGDTEYGLEYLGHELTESGMEVGNEFEGLVVARVYRLPGAEARRDSKLILIYHS
jgi:hypothetical protein